MTNRIGAGGITCANFFLKLFTLFHASTSDFPNSRRVPTAFKFGCQKNM